MIDVVINKISPIREEMSRLTTDKKYLREILDVGSSRAKKIAADVLKEVYEVTGLNSNI